MISYDRFENFDRLIRNLLADTVAGHDCNFHDLNLMSE
jgi:hypothetical protein